MPDQTIPDRLRDYTDVKERIGLFYKAHPDGRLVTDRVEIWQDDDIPRVVVRALAYRSPDDTLPGTGWSWMVLPGTTSFTRGSEIENTETSAWGRAIGSLGIGISKGIGSADEIVAHEGQQDAQAGDGSLIGTVAKGQDRETDMGLRISPGGDFVGFSLHQGTGRLKVVAVGPLAGWLAPHLEKLIDQRVTVWGRIEMVPWSKGGRDMRPYRRLILERIQTPDFILPATVASPPDTVAGEAVPEPLGLT